MVQEKDNLINQLETTRVENVRHSSTGVVTVGGQKFAVGLVWQPLQNLDDPIVEIRESAESELGADLYCLRPAATPQYGIGHSEMGHKDGMPSLAAAVAAALSDTSSVCAVFRVDEGWWLIAIRNDLILAEEDVVFANEVDAQKAYAAMMAVPDWDLKIVPPEWNIEGVQQRDLTKLVHSVRKVRLQEINAQRKTQFLLGITVAIVAVVGYLIYLVVGAWQTIFQDKVLERPEPPVIKFDPVAPAPSLHKPWDVVPDIHAFFNQCWVSAHQVQAIIVPGWTMGTVQCTPKELTTSWRLTNVKEGRLSWMKFGVQQYQLSNFKMDISADGTSVNGSMQFSNIPMVPSKPKLTVKELEEDVREIQQSTGLTFQFTRQTLLDPPNRADGSRPPNQKSYTYYAFSVLSPYAPMEWQTFFEKFSGLELTKLEYTPSGDATNKWKYEGRIYAK